MSLIAKDTWKSKASEYDKLYHLFGCFALFFFLVAFIKSGHATLWVVAIAGLVWEVKDIFWADGFSWRDLVADITGALVAYLWFILWF